MKHFLHTEPLARRGAAVRFAPALTATRVTAKSKGAPEKLVIQKLLDTLRARLHNPQWSRWVNGTCATQEAVADADSSLSERQEKMRFQAPSRLYTLSEHSLVKTCNLP